jgi:DNA invertase Pin-like site-specific DNA recombinase
VDRLTRSLADFAKIVELFDAKGVSFVSVTQAFNTTSSMGRLTLNVLLSFAQFEREVTGERIRDKVAASKARGLRMGGRPPLGYDIQDGKLAVNAEEAPRVRRIFERYLELGAIQALEREGVEGKCWVNKRGEIVGGGQMSRGALHYLLKNPAYRGITRHKDKRYDDTHPAIVGPELWDAVQAHLATANTSQPKSELRGEGAPLDGKVFDDRGNAMVPVHTKRGVKRYRYYLSRAKLSGRGEAGSLHRIAAGVLEEFMVERIEPMLGPAWRPGEAAADRVFDAVSSAMLSEDQIVVRLSEAALSSDTLASTEVARDEGGACVTRAPFHMHRRQGALILLPADEAAAPAAKVDRALVRAMALARSWSSELESGRVGSISALAQRENLCSHYTARLLPLAYLAPDLVEKILEGRQPRAASLGALTAEALPLDWTAQRERLQRLGAA